MARRFGNFDTMRLVAASSVIFSHSFLLADGHDRNEPLIRLLGPGNIVGIYGVYTFLIISGFLVSQSLRSSSSIPHFLWKRALRVYPGLIICAIVTACVLGPIFSTETTMAYFDHGYAQRYVLDVLLLKQPNIASVVFYAGQDSLGLIVNGSLWSIRAEVLCYLVLVVVSITGLFRLWAAIGGLAVSAVLLFLAKDGSLQPKLGETLANLCWVLSSFYAGVVMYFIHERFQTHRTIAVACLAGLLLLLLTRSSLFMIFFQPLAAYVIVHLGVSRSVSLVNVTRFGDLSYGT